MATTNPNCKYRSGLLCHWSKFAGLMWRRDLFKQEMWGDSEKRFASAVVLQGKLMQKHWLPLIREKLQSSSNRFKLLVAQIYIYIHYLKHSWRIHKIRSRIMWFKWICYTGLLCQRSKFERPRASKNGTKLFYFLKAVGDHLCRVGVHGNVLKCTQTRVQLPLKTLPVDVSASQDYDWGEPYHTWSHFWSHIAYLSAVQLSFKLWKTTNARPSSRPNQNQNKTNAQLTCISAGNCFRLPLPYKIVRWNRFFLTSRPTWNCF